MSEVELGYFSLPYNKKNEKTIVTNVTNLDIEGFIIKVGQPDSKCRVNVKEDLITVINKVKPDLVTLKKSDKDVQDFCKLIKVNCEIRSAVSAALDIATDVSIENSNPQLDSETDATGE
jgi:hypothetical protein